MFEIHPQNRQVYRQGQPEAAHFTEHESPDIVKILLGDGSAAAIAAAAHAKKVENCLHSSLIIIRNFTVN